MPAPHEHQFDAKIRLAPVSMQHKDALFETINNNRDHLRQWMTWVDDTKSSEDLVNFITDSEKGFEKGTSANFHIFYDDKLCGNMGFNYIQKDNSRAAIGYWLAKEFTGKGIITKCCSELLRYAFEELELNKIEIHANPNNKPSCAIPERLGFKKEVLLGSERNSPTVATAIMLSMEC